MHAKKEKKDRIMFICFIAAAVVLGCLMLLWGQHNSAEQVFEIGFLHFRVSDQLANDESYVFSESDGEKYGEMLELGKSWREQAGGIDGSCATETAAAIFGEFALYDMPYTFYNNGSDTTVILLHGYNETVDDAAIAAPWWWDGGYNILIPQLRGYSDKNQLTTFGEYEQYDLYDLIRAAGLEESRIIVHGRGTGAAAALLAAANAEYDCGIDLIVADSVYSDLETLKQRQLKAQFGLGEIMVGKMLSGIAKKQLGFELSDVNICAAAASSSVPKLFVCGESDSFTLPEESRSVYEAAQGVKELAVIAGAGNRMAYTSSWFGGGEYCAAMDKFIENNLK